MISDSQSCAHETVGEPFVLRTTSISAWAYLSRSDLTPQGDNISVKSRLSAQSSWGRVSVDLPRQVNCFFEKWPVSRGPADEYPWIVCTLELGPAGPVR